MAINGNVCGLVHAGAVVADMPVNRNVKLGVYAARNAVLPAGIVYGNLAGRQVVQGLIQVPNGICFQVERGH